MRDAAAHTAAPVLALLEVHARGARSQCGAHAREAGEAAEGGLIIAAASHVRYSQITGAATPRTTTTAPPPMDTATPLADLFRRMNDQALEDELRELRAARVTEVIAHAKALLAAAEPRLRRGDRLR